MRAKLESGASFSFVWLTILIINLKVIPLFMPLGINSAMLFQHFL